ncbi:LolA-like protein [Granulicella arctica]|uniref:hypothetical protein n=1 Tax=Granulicella arctica TaxID=940613 RepID=UPI0021DF69F7|nr:hypothetical protein [Granulicella arctica]
MRRLVRVVVLFGFVSGCAIRLVGEELSANAIVVQMMERNRLRQAMLQHYASDRSYHLEYNGTTGEHHAEMKVHVEYTAPGRKLLTVVGESGSKVLCAQVLRKLVEGEQETADKQNWQRAMFSPETYNFQLLGRETLDGMSTWVLQVEPKVASRVDYRGKLWVSTDDFAMVRLQAEPAKSPSWLLSHASFDSWYMRRGEVWLPEKNVSTTHVRIGGEAKVTIDYGLYQVLATSPVSAAFSSPAEEVPVRSRATSQGRAGSVLH